jgi:hypothetical protein
MEHEDPRAEVGRKEERLRELRAAPAPHDTGAIAAVEREIDQLWDLVRQREALERAGEDPADAEVRPQSQVEGYRQ